MRHFLFAMPLLTLAALLAACGSGDKPASAPAADAATAQVPTPAATPPAAAPSAPVASVSYASLTGDAAKGEKIFAQCKACHVAEAGVNRVGPSLYGVVGRPAGSIAGFNYSKANKGSGITWSEDVLFAYLEAPQKYLPGTRMAFAGLKQPQDRADVIAYLKTRA
ncbi:c-type cytochrome [Sandarakinorhabdus oryzae]|uniref:c-type cytochrome n=1 Tax=Sandarakinorhabdus oryzae TaxID=2675220 RepID=UPI001F2FA36E|nr:cytochrome c family protein [Sandarakinorhabdus oryzae]